MVVEKEGVLARLSLVVRQAVCRLLKMPAQWVKTLSDLQIKVVTLPSPLKQFAHCLTNSLKTSYLVQTHLVMLVFALIVLVSLVKTL